MQYTMLVVYLFLLLGCGGGKNNSFEGEYLDIYTNSDEIKVERVDSLNFKTNLNNKYLYILFSNVGNKSINLNIKKAEFTKSIAKTYQKKSTNIGGVSNSLKMDIIHLNHKNINEKILNIEMGSQDENLFYLEKDTSLSTRATVRKVVKNVDTKYGKKSLNIWVSDDSYGDNCSKQYCIKDYMLDKLADSFLKDGEENDIYDWVTNIFGEEWGDSSNNNLIKRSDEISILLTDIDNDNRIMSGMMGYFYAKDNYKRGVYSGSNERVMLYLDSVLYASYYGEDEWSINNKQTKKVLSTLAHEFEHMIQFYQKNTLQKNSGFNPWIDEMLAIATEDIIATKLETDGVRGVPYYRGDAGDDYNPYGRFPIFNQNINNKTLTSWSDSLEDYATVASFGAYLIRNYNGAKLLHDIMHSRYSDERAIEEAVKKSPYGADKKFDNLIQDWGIAVLLSGYDDLDAESGYLYNLGEFIYTEYNGINYSLGSINFFKYENRPNIVTTDINVIAPKSNLYYRVSDRNISIKVDKNPNLKVALIYTI